MVLQRVARQGAEGVRCVASAGLPVPPVGGTLRCVLDTVRSAGRAEPRRVSSKTWHGLSESISPSGV